MAPCLDGGEQLNQLTNELDITRSQVVEEALALLFAPCSRYGGAVASRSSTPRHRRAAHRTKLVLDAKASGPTRLVDGAHAAGTERRSDDVAGDLRRREHW
jgi:hypothetical protein